MKAGTKVKTPDGKGVVIAPIGKAHRDKPILVKLDKPLALQYVNFYYSEDELIKI